MDNQEVAQLAYLNWKKDGCPSGRDLNYWLEAESQLKATKHLYLQEDGNAGPSSQKVETSKTKVKKARKASIRRELVTQP